MSITPGAAPAPPACGRQAAGPRATPEASPGAISPRTSASSAATLITAFPGPLRRSRSAAAAKESLAWPRQHLHALGGLGATAHAGYREDYEYKNNFFAMECNVQGGSGSGLTEVVLTQ